MIKTSCLRSLLFCFNNKSVVVNVVAGDEGKSFFAFVVVVDR